jgi:hypothetical protein
MPISQRMAGVKHERLRPKREAYSERRVARLYRIIVCNEDMAPLRETHSVCMKTYKVELWYGKLWVGWINPTQPNPTQPKSGVHGFEETEQEAGRK